MCESAVRARIISNTAFRGSDTEKRANACLLFEQVAQLILIKSRLGDYTSRCSFVIIPCNAPFGRGVRPHSM